MDLEPEKVLLDLDTYIASCENRLKTILSALDWTGEDTLRDSTCSRKSSEEHKIEEGEPLLPESFDCMHSIVIDEDQLKKILKTDNVSIPKTFSDIQLNFTREQKCEIYDYVILNTGKISEPELKVSVPKDNQSGNDMTFAEIVAKAKKKDKNLKRKYRTSKPTHIEEVRNLVHLQMQALSQYFNPKSSITEVEDRRKFEEHESVERSRHRSRSRGRRSWRSPYRKKSRSRSKEWKNRSQERGSRNVAVGRTSRARRSKSVSRSRSTKEKHRRHTRSRSSISAASYSRNYESSTSHRKEKSNHSSTKKHKKRSRSRSKSRHKSSKSKKHKHKNKKN